MCTHLLFYKADDCTVHVKSGLCVIFSNEVFPDESRRRIGTMQDVKRLEEVFQWLGFKVDPPHIDLKKRDMEKKMIEYKDQKYQDCDAFFCFIMSHGTDGAIVTVDDKEIRYETIRNVFLQSDGLCGKPKYFFIQACRGTDLPRLRTVVADGGSADDEEKDQSKLPEPSSISSDGFDRTTFSQDVDFTMMTSCTEGRDLDITTMCFLFDNCRLMC